MQNQHKAVMYTQTQKPYANQDLLTLLNQCRVYSDKFLNCIFKNVLMLLHYYTTKLHPCNVLFSTTWVNRCQKGKTGLDLNEARDDEVLGRQWHQLDHMQTICTSLQTDNHTNTSSLDANARVRRTLRKVCHNLLTLIL